MHNPGRERERDGKASPSLRHVRAAQMRAKVVRWAIGKSTLGSLFLVGALSYGLAPENDRSGNSVWMAVLVVLSTFNVGLGLRTFSRLHRGARRFWFPATLAWGGLSTALLRILVTGKP
jgi:hypothetical protein